MRSISGILIVCFTITIAVDAQDTLNCANGKSCFGIPTQSGCQNGEFSKCDHLVTYAHNTATNLFDFELYSHSSSEYTAVGFSADAQMGDDAVVSCLAPQPDRIILKMSRNEGTQNLPVSSDNQKVLKSGKSEIHNGKLRCEFSLPVNFRAGPLSIDLKNNKNILLTGGKLSGNDISYHGGEKGSTSAISQINLISAMIPEQANNLSKTYSESDGCGETRSCFGIRSKEGCGDKKFDKCTHVLSYSYDPSTDLMEFVLHAHETSEYTAVGLSTDTRMGNDAVISCFSNPSNQIFVKMSWNEGKLNRVVSPEAISLLEIGFKDGELICKFNLPSKFNAGPIAINLIENKYHVMIAGGKISGENIGYHSEERASVTHAVKLTDKPQILLAEKEKKLYKLLHTIGMSLSFLFFMPIGTFISRFYKETWTNVRIKIKCCTHRLWFILHITCMLLALIFAMSAYFIIAGTYSPDSAWFFPTKDAETGYIHNIVGLSALTLLLIQCTAHWFRLSNQKLARLAELTHWAIGLICYILGVLNLGFAKKWLHPDFDCSAVDGSCDCKRGLLVLIWVILHMIFYALMSGYISWTDWHLKIGGWRAVCDYPLPMVSSEEAPRPRFRKVLLVLFVCTSFTMTILVILTTPCIL